MNRILFLLIKTAFAFLIVLFQFPVLAIDYYSTRDGFFNDPKTWTTTPLTNKPVTKVIFNDGANSFNIRNGHTVTINSGITISIAALKIIGVNKAQPSILNIFSTGSVINGALTIENGEIDFGTGNSDLTVNGSLLGGQSSVIIHKPVKGTKQTLTLNGASNSLTEFDCTISSSISEVIYSGTKQNIFSSNNYSTLIARSKGIKTLSGDITVKDKLEISNTYIEIKDFNLEYAGAEQNLYATTGWVSTNGTGVYINSNSGSSKTFPVGDAASMQKITLSDINNTSAAIGMRYNASDALAGNGLRGWNLQTILANNFTATINPASGSTGVLTSNSKIAFYNDTDLNPTWQVQETAFASANGSYTSASPFGVTTGNTWFMLYNCPTYTITPASLPISYTGELFNDVTFSVNSSSNTTIDLENLLISTTSNQLLKDFTFTSGILKSKNIFPPAQKSDFKLTYKDGNNCSASNNYVLIVTNSISPNLSMFSIDTKTFGADSFPVRTYSRSKGGITYSISGGCASINPSTGIVKITCAGPSPNNQITVTATQAADGIYKAESVSKSFIINPAPGRIYIKNFAFLLSNNSSINVITKSSPATLKFEQLSGFNEAIVTEEGIVDMRQTGSFTVHISLAATNNYTAFDSVYTFNVYELQKPPVAVADTIVLEMGRDSTFNILLNDQGQTSEINTRKTDIDVENRGQQIKYYATELGNFDIDTAGNLTVIPFYGFIGNGRLGYTITDLNGFTSEVAYVEVTVKPPYVVPELKVNQIMTPNDDNLNDALVIANTDLSKENSLLIIDQAGNTVYETENYQNNWEGVDTKGNKVEPGVYFYTFKEKTSGRELKNYIQIVK